MVYAGTAHSHLYAWLRQIRNVNSSPIPAHAIIMIFLYILFTLHRGGAVAIAQLLFSFGLFADACAGFRDPIAQRSGKNKQTEMNCVVGVAMVSYDERITRFFHFNHLTTCASPNSRSQSSIIRNWYRRLSATRCHETEFEWNYNLVGSMTEMKHHTNMNLF